MKNVIYIINEIKGITESLKTNLNYNIVRDYRGDNKSFIGVSLNQSEDVPAIIICSYHKFEMQQVEIAGGQRRFWTKTSLVINVANNLHNRGVEVTILNYKGKIKETIKILPQDNFQDKIDELCGTYNTKKSKSGRLGLEFKKTDNYQKPKLLKFDDFKTYNIPVPSKKEMDLFIRYASVYGLNPNEPTDLVSFRYFVQHPEFAEDFIEGGYFKCPHCSNLVRVNGHEEFIAGKFINTNETICDLCGKEFEIHDKQDILEQIICK